MTDAHTEAREAMAGVLADPRVQARFWAKVNKTDTCWLWTAYRTRDDYGRFWLNGKLERAHRVSFWLAGREIPLGLVMDHLCRTPACVNPDHLEAVTISENTRRGDAAKYLPHDLHTHCKRGHEFTEQNIRWTSQGGRVCVACETERDRRRTLERWVCEFCGKTRAAHHHKAHLKAMHADEVA